MTRVSVFVLLAACALAMVALSAQGPRQNYPTMGRIVREDPRLDRLIPADARIEVLASGFDWAEGPVWIKDGGYLLFSDVPRNTIYKWKEGEGISVFMKPSGYTGVIERGPEPGSNGLTVDAQGRLVLAEHGDRRISRVELDGGKWTVADNYQGKRLNSPNDVVVHSSGDIYFTDPPYGLPKQSWDSPYRELDFCGVYRVKPDRTVTLLTKELVRPNGLAFSHDEKILYVAQSDRERPVIMAYPVKPDGTLGEGRVFADCAPLAKQGLPGSPDGLKVDREGNVFATGPGGVHVYAPDGTRLGRIETGERTANVAWGDDGSVLYLTADMYLARVKTSTRGAGVHLN